MSFTETIAPWLFRPSLPSSVSTSHKTWGEGLKITQNDPLSLSFITWHVFFFFFSPVTWRDNYFQYNLFSPQQKWHRGFRVLKTHDIIQSFSDAPRLMRSSVGPCGGSWRRSPFKPCYLVEKDGGNGVMISWVILILLRNLLATFLLVVNVLLGVNWCLSTVWFLWSRTWWNLHLVTEKVF